jgi:hypothetical protein
LARAFGEQQSGPTLARGSVLYDIAHDLVVYRLGLSGHGFATQAAFRMA